MRKICYQVACSLDGYIAGPDGEYDWIPADPTIDFGALFERFDTLLMGRATYEAARASGQTYPGKRIVVLSRTLRAEEHPDVTVIGSDVGPRIRAMRREAGRDIWLYGGGETFRRLLAMGLVDTVEPAVVPILLGGGVPLLPSPAARTMLSLRSHRVYPSGIVWFNYDVRVGGATSAAGENGR